LLDNYDCAGNPVSDEQHKNDIISSINMLCSFLFEKQFFNKDKLNLIGVYINKDFEIEEIVEIDIK
jgi:hypothetical protein